MAQIHDGCILRFQNKKKVKLENSWHTHSKTALPSHKPESEVNSSGHTHNKVALQSHEPESEVDSINWFQIWSTTQTKAIKASQY